MARRKAAKTVTTAKGISKMPKEVGEAVLSVLRDPGMVKSAECGAADFNAGRGTVYKSGERPGLKKKPKL